MQELRINDWDLGASWKAVEAWLREGPLVLIRATKGPESVRARLDLDKRLFIDPTPFESSGMRVDELVAYVRTQSRRRAVGYAR